MLNLSCKSLQLIKSVRLGNTAIKTGFKSEYFVYNIYILQG